MFSVYPFPLWWLIRYIYTLSYYHHQMGSMNYYPLFRVRSWNNGAAVCLSMFLFFWIWIWIWKVYFPGGKICGQLEIPILCVHFRRTVPYPPLDICHDYHYQRRQQPLGSKSMWKSECQPPWTTPYCWGRSRQKCLGNNDISNLLYVWRHNKPDIKSMHPRPVMCRYPIGTEEQ